MSNIPVDEARRIGAKSGLLGFLCMFLLTEAIGVYQTTREDIGSGVAVFFEDQVNILFFGVFIVAAAMAFFLGRSAGKRILVDGRLPIGVAMLYALYTAAALLGTILLYGAFTGHRYDLISSLIAILALISGCIWLIAILNIRRAAR